MVTEIIDNNMENRREILVCECSSVEHQIVFNYDEENERVYCSIHLVELPFWKRLKNGLKYIFGYKCKYGHFDEFVLAKYNIKQLNKVVYFLKNVSKV
jgi:hypothetical protein